MVSICPCYCLGMLFCTAWAFPPWLMSDIIQFIEIYNYVSMINTQFTTIIYYSHKASTYIEILKKIFISSDLVTGRSFNFLRGDFLEKIKIFWFWSSVKNTKCFWWLVKKYINSLSGPYLNEVNMKKKMKRSCEEFKKLFDLSRSRKKLFDLSRSRKKKKNSDVKANPPAMDIKWSAP